MTKEFNFTVLNKLAKEHGIVLFGSTSAAQIPINELVQDYGITQHIYNRSIENLHIADAEKYLECCIYSLKPDKVILSLGEEDLTEDCDIPDLIEQYRWLLYKIHTVLPKTSLILTSVILKGTKAELFNNALEALSEECGCDFLIMPTENNPIDYDLHFFRTIKPVFYDSNMSYADIVQYCAI